MICLARRDVCRSRAKRLAGLADGGTARLDPTSVKIGIREWQASLSIYVCDEMTSTGAMAWPGEARKGGCVGSVLEWMGWS